MQIRSRKFLTQQTTKRLQENSAPTFVKKSLKFSQEGVTVNPKSKNKTRQ